MTHTNTPGEKFVAVPMAYPSQKIVLTAAVFLWAAGGGNRVGLPKIKNDPLGRNFQKIFSIPPKRQCNPIRPEIEPRPKVRWTTAGALVQTSNLTVSIVSGRLGRARYSLSLFENVIF